MSLSPGKKKILKRTLAIAVAAIIFFLFAKDLAEMRSSTQHPNNAGLSLSVQDPNKNRIPDAVTPQSWLNIPVAPQAGSPQNKTPNPSAQSRANSKTIASGDTPPVLPFDTFVPPSASVGQPEISSLSNSTFGNGDTITIFGKNFTKNNTLLFSIDLPKSFISVPSSDGTTITFAPSFLISQSIAANLDKLSPAVKAQALAKIAAKTAVQSGIAGGWYVRGTLAVQNENGTSNKIPVTINLLSGI